MKARRHNSTLAIDRVSSSLDSFDVVSRPEIGLH